MRRGHWWVVGIWLGAVAVRLLLIATPFRYVTDVYYYDSQAVRALLAGSDPYGHAYSVPPALATAGAANVFAYLPGVVEFLAPFGAATDVRVGLVACDLVVAVSLASMGGRRASGAALAYLVVPTSILFSTWYPNDTLVGMAFLASSVALTERRAPRLSAALFGAALASSQFVWLFAPFVMLAQARRWDWRDAAVGGGVFAALTAPFVVWNPGAFFADTVSFEFGRPVQSLVTPEPFGFNVNPTLAGLTREAFGAAVPVELRVAVAVAVLVALLRMSRTKGGELLWGSLFVVIAVFVLPSDFSWWYLDLPLTTFLMWFVLSAEDQALARGPLNP